MYHKRLNPYNLEKNFDSLQVNGQPSDMSVEIFNSNETSPKMRSKLRSSTKAASPKGSRKELADHKIKEKHRIRRNNSKFIIDLKTVNPMKG